MRHPLHPFYPVVTALALAHCECTENLENLPDKDVEVCTRSGDQCASPEDLEMEVELGALEVGGTARASFRVKNVGKLPITVSRVGRALGTTSSGDFTLDPGQVGGEIGRDGTLEFNIVYRPLDGGPDAAVFVVESDDPDEGSVRIRVTGSALGARICPEPDQAAVDFGIVDVGASSDRELVLSSCGNRALVVNALEVTDSAGGHFELVTPPALPLSLEPGTSVTLALRYTGVAVGSSTGTLTVRSNAAGTPEGSVVLLGRAAACDLTVSPTSLVYPATYQGVEARADVAVTNSGERPCTLQALERVDGSSEFTLVPPATALPAVLAPSAVSTFTFAYKPTNAGTDHATFRLASSDPVNPQVDIALEGRDNGQPDCLLQVDPATYNFGSVARNTTATGSVAVRNVGGRACFLLAVAAAPGGDPDFTFTLSALSAFGLQPGASTNVTVKFTPSRSGHRAATLLVKGGIAQNVLASGSVEGNGTGAQLCVTPSLLDFGVVPVGTVVTRDVSVGSCGSDAVTVTGESLAPAPSEFVRVGAPLANEVIAPGDARTVTLRYAPTNDGRDEGTLSFTDSAGDDPVVNLVGHAVTGTVNCGNVAGRVCAPDQSAWLGGARVSVTTGGQTYQATTAPDGRFVLSCVPPGNHTLQVDSGNFSTQAAVTVTTGTTTTLAEPACVDPGSARVAVVWGCWDSIGDILTRLGVGWDQWVFSGSNEGCSSDAPGGPDASTLLGDPAELMQYDVLFINCGADDSYAYDTTVQMNLRNFVAAGGSFFASDWAYDYVEATWPDAVDFRGNDQNQGEPQGGGSDECQAHVDSASLRQTLGVTLVPISMCCTDTEAVPATTSKILTCQDTGRAGHPQMLQFEPTAGGGRVTYTTFHDAEQQAATVDATFSWLIFQL